MATPAPGSFGMRSEFHDANTQNDYDRKIDTTRQAMNQHNDPCKSLNDMYTLIHTLRLVLPTYKPRPCIEGFCWSSVVPFDLMTPHRSRIERRIQVLTSEANTLHAPACQLYLADKDKEKDRQFKLQLSKQELEARLKATKTTTETTTRTDKTKGIF